MSVLHGEGLHNRESPKPRCALLCSTNRGDRSTSVRAEGLSPLCLRARQADDVMLSLTFCRHRRKNLGSLTFPDSTRQAALPRDRARADCNENRWGCMKDETLISAGN